MCVIKLHAFIYFLRPPPWSGTSNAFKSHLLVYFSQQKSSNPRWLSLRRPDQWESRFVHPDYLIEMGNHDKNIVFNKSWIMDHELCVKHTVRPLPLPLAHLGDEFIEKVRFSRGFWLGFSCLKNTPPRVLVLYCLGYSKYYLIFCID